MASVRPSSVGDGRRDGASAVSGADAAGASGGVVTVASTAEPRAAFTKGGLRVDVFTDRLATAYDVGKAVGKGKFSTVYKATRRSDGIAVALKRVAIFDIMDDKSREKCLKEIELVRSLDHDNIIRFLDGFVEGNELILVFEYAEAGDLKRQLRKAKEREARFDERVVWKYFAQITSAVAHMHARRIMHRDLKPANIFLTLNGTVKVGDLGLGRLMSENTMEAHSKVGTPLYMSPEVLRGKGYELKSDIWSLGCILYELAMLRSPFKEDGLNLYGLFQKINEGKYPPVSPVYSEELRGLVDRMLQQDPTARPDVEEVHRIAVAMRDKMTRARALQASPAAVEAPPAPSPAPADAMPSRPTSAAAAVPGVLLAPAGPEASKLAGYDAGNAADGEPAHATGVGSIAMHGTMMDTPARPEFSRPPPIRTDSGASPKHSVVGRTPTAGAAPTGGDDTDTDADGPVAYVQIMEAAAAVARDAGLPDPFPERTEALAPPPRARARPESASRRRPPSAAAPALTVDTGIAFATPAGAPPSKVDPRASPESKLPDEPVSGTPSMAHARPPRALTQPISISRPPAASASLSTPTPARVRAPTSPVSNAKDAESPPARSVTSEPPAVLSGGGSLDRLSADGMLELVDSSPELAETVALDLLTAVCSAAQRRAGIAADAAIVVLQRLRSLHRPFAFALPGKSTFVQFGSLLDIVADAAVFAGAGPSPPPSTATVAREVRSTAEQLRAGAAQPFTAAGVLLRNLASLASPHLPIPSSVSTLTPATLTAGAGAALVRLLMFAAIVCSTSWQWHPSPFSDVHVVGEPEEEEAPIEEDEEVHGGAAIDDDDVDIKDANRGQDNSAPLSFMPGAASPASTQLWMQELERVRPRLVALDCGVAASLSGSASVGAVTALAATASPSLSSPWRTHTTELRTHHSLAGAHTDSVAKLRAVGERAAAELEAIAHAEARWNVATATSTTPSTLDARGSSGVPTAGGIAGLVAQYRDVRDHAQQLTTDVARSQDACTSLSAQLAEVEDAVAAATEAVDGHADAHGGTHRLQSLRTALATLREQARGMDLQLQLARTQLLHRHAQRDLAKRRQQDEED